MRPYALVYLYRSRLRVHAVQELLAGLGVAIAVALVFATTVADGSIAGSAGEVVHAVIGPANLQLRARGADGFDERCSRACERLPGVKQAAPLLEQTATIVGRTARRVTVDLAGTDMSLAVLDGLAHTLPIATLSPGGIGLSRASAAANSGSRIRAHADDSDGVAASCAARATRAEGLRGARDPKRSARSRRRTVAVMPLADLQQLAACNGRITRILVQTEPGREAAVRAELQTLAGGRLTVAAADQDVALLRQALRPSDQASGFFAAISALLGFLFAFNAMLLTVPERRQAIADLRLVGARRTAIVQMVIFQALCLGIAASLVGLLAGYVLSLGVFHQSTGYLAEAFTLGTQHRRRRASRCCCRFSAGCWRPAWPRRCRCSTCAAGARWTPSTAKSGVPGNALGRRRPASAWRSPPPACWRWRPRCSCCAPSLALRRVRVLALATVLAVPLVFAGVLRAAASPGRALPAAHDPAGRAHLAEGHDAALARAGRDRRRRAVRQRRAGRRARRSAARHHGFAHSYVADADIWVINPGDNQAAVEAFPALPTRPRIAQIARGRERAQPSRAASWSSATGACGSSPARPAPSRQVLESQIVDGNASTQRAHASGRRRLDRRLQADRRRTSLRESEAR